MVVTQVERRIIKGRAGKRLYRQEGRAAEESLKAGKTPVVIIAVTQNGVPVIAKEDELVALFNKEPLPKRGHRPNTKFGPR